MCLAFGHHSLATPIDWKLRRHGHGENKGNGHHSLVTSIVYKRKLARKAVKGFIHVSIHWRHLLIADFDFPSYSQEIDCSLSPLVDDTY